MSLTTLIQKGIDAAFDSPLIEILADKIGVAQAVPILKEHFTFTAFEIASAYQDSYEQALTAINAGLAAPEQKFAFLQKFTHSKLTREFSDQIDSLYLQLFAKAIEKESTSELRQQLIEQIERLSEQPLTFEAENTPFTDTELAAFINDKGTSSITDLVLEQLGNRVPDLLAQFLHYHELLGNAILFFLRERLRKDERTEKTLAALQREKLLLGTDEIKQGMAEQKALLQELMQRFALSKQIKPSDEFTHHSSDSRQLIQAAIAKLPVLSKHNREYNQLVIMAGSVLSSTGDIDEAESLFLQARNEAQNQADKALASFNLFQIRLRCQAYEKALADLQTAIKIDSKRYALHHVEKYPIQQILGAGGMGCVFLCHDQWGENQVVVKCFWKGRKGKRDDVFKEALLMRDIAGDYVPKPIDCDYTDPIQQERPYFVTEYIAQAKDGEAWLAEHGKLDLRTGLAVGLEIAKGLQVAHQKGIYHLDLKPANVLLKQTQTALMVKIIDFGLARVATSLKQEAMSRSHTHQTQFGQTIIGSLYYAPPEQLGHSEYGKPSAKSDLFSFGATLYRLMTGESPQNLNPRRLAEAPPALFELLCDCKEENPERRPDIDSVIARLSGLLKTQQLKPGNVFRDPLTESGFGPEMVVIPAGTFRMGDIQGTGGDREKPVHEVSVKSFAMGRYPLTVGEFRQFVEATGYKTEAETGGGSYVWKGNNWQQVEDANWRNPSFPQEAPQEDNQPVVCISWNDTKAYIDWLTEQTGQEYRLPSEAQWEYAARAGTDTDYWWGNKFARNRVNCRGSGRPSQWSGKQTAPVGSFKPNPFGLYDTAGNVWEWCADRWWHDNYKGAPTDGSVWEGDGSLFVLRGGSWNSGARQVRSAYREKNQQTYGAGNCGVRLAIIL